MLTLILRRGLGSRLLNHTFLASLNASRDVSYVQGQSRGIGGREYFYFIDHQGQLFLDDARMKNFTSCFKEKTFLRFFFKQLRINETGKYEEDFPYYSPCGREKNYIRCDDLPIVFTKIIGENPDKPGKLEICNCGTRLHMRFEPEKLCMLPETGRIYHPAPDKMGGVGLIKSSIAIDISTMLEFEGNDDTKPPTHFTWKEVRYTLTNEILPLISKSSKLNEKIQ